MISNKIYKIISLGYHYLVKPCIISFGGIFLCSLFKWDEVPGLTSLPLSDLSINFSINALLISEFFSFIDTAINKLKSRVFIRLSNSSQRFNIIRSKEVSDTEHMTYRPGPYHIYLLIKTVGKIHHNSNDFVKVHFPKFIRAISDKSCKNNGYSDADSNLYFRLPKSGVVSADISLTPNKKVLYDDDDANAVLNISTYDSLFIRSINFGEINIELTK